MDGITQDTSAPIDTDALVSQIENAAPYERPMEAPAPKEEAAPTEAATEWKPAFDKFDFKHNGKDRFLNLTSQQDYDRAKQWIQQGYDYAQKMNQFKSEYGQFLDLGKDRLKQFVEIDQFAKQNPDWWRHVETSWQSKGQQPAAEGQAPDPIAELKTEFQRKLEEIESRFHEKETQQKLQEEDSALDTEVKSVRDSYPQYNFDQIVGDNGETLEFKVLEHAAKIGTNSFRAAFRDFYHDQLTKDAELKAKESAAKQRQKMAKQGLLGVSQAPKKGLQPAQNLKAKSYDDLVREGAAEFGIEL